MKIVSLFSGAGGLDLGLINAGHDIIWANDFDADAVATYRRNIGPEIVLGDICDIPSSEIPVCDVVVGASHAKAFLKLICFDLPMTSAIAFTSNSCASFATSSRFIFSLRM